VSGVPSLAEELDALGQVLAEARVAVAAGHVVELAGLAEHTRELCARLEAAPQSDAESHVPLLLSLRDQLDRLAEDIHGLLQDITGQTDDAGTRRAAATAYGKPPNPK